MGSLTGTGSTVTGRRHVVDACRLQTPVRQSGNYPTRRMESYEDVVTEDSGEVREAIAAVTRGDAGSSETLVALLYGKLRDIAHRRLSRDMRPRMRL